MHIASHLEKIERYESARRRLDPLEDFELWFWATMCSGTNAVNAALHHAGITPAESAFPSQPGVYHVPAAQGEPVAVLKELGDVLHVGRPAIKAPVPADIAAMMKAMDRIEAYRDPCTRGEMDINPQVVADCETAYADSVALMKQRLQGAH
jgi:hypothetical protein